MSIKLSDNIIFVAGGTGGHIFPALAVYNLFNNEGNKLFFATDHRGLRFEEILNINPFLINALGFEGKGFFKKIVSLVFIIYETFRAIFFIKKNKIKIIIGFGSYVQVPFVLAGLIMKKNIILHEGNAVIGKANKIFWKYIKVRTSAYNLKNFFPDTVQVGMPVRGQITNLYNNKYEPKTSKGLFNLLILGGSQGSNILSTNLSKVIIKLPIYLRKNIIIFHQVRNEHLSIVKKIYKKNNIKSYVDSFFKDISNYIGKASLVISRAGSSTIHENIIAGIPAIYFPIKKSVGNHQYENALVLKKNNAAWIFNEEDIGTDTFLKALSQIISQPELLKQFSFNNKNLGKPFASQSFKEIILGLEVKDV